MNPAPPRPPERSLSDAIFAPLAALRRRARLYLLLDGVVRLVLALTVGGLAQLLIDRWLKLTIDQRAALNLAITTFWFWVIYRYLVVRVVRPLTDEDLAAVVDRRNPQLFDQLTTAVQFARGRVGDPRANSPQLVDSVLHDAARDVGRVDFLAVLDHRQAIRRTSEMLVLLAVVALAFVVMPSVMYTWFHRNWFLADLPWPQRTYILPVGYENGMRHVAIGDELEIEARIEGEPPTTAELLWSAPSGRNGREDMTRRGRSLVVSLGVVTEDVRFRIVGGDERTAAYSAVAVARPQVVRTAVHVTPPAYTGLDPLTVEQQATVEVLRGAEVVIEAWLNKPIASAGFHGVNGLLRSAELMAPDHVRVRLGTAPPNEPAVAAPTMPAGTAPSGPALLESGTYHFELVDRDRFNDRRPVRFTIKVVADRPPGVDLKLTGVGQLITPRAEIPAEVKFEDLYGLSSVALAAQIGEDVPHTRVLDGFAPPQRTFQTTRVVPASAYGVAPGQQLKLWAEAADLDPRGPNVGRSPAIEMRVVTVEEFSNDLARRELELRRDFERLMGEQRVLADALERLLAVDAADGAPSASTSQQLAGLARRQSTHAARVLTIRKQFDQILAEMQTNRVARAADERRLRDRIVAPLLQVARESMSAATDQLNGLRRQLSADRRAAARSTQSEILRQMRAILADMLEWEGYREAVALLREIINEQGEVRSETLKAVERQLEAILEEDEPTPANSAPAPRP